MPQEFRVPLVSILRLGINHFRMAGDPPSMTDAELLKSFAEHEINSLSIFKDH
jgi:hypothetical protein